MNSLNHGREATLKNFVDFEVNAKAMSQFLWRIWKSHGQEQEKWDKKQNDTVGSWSDL